MDKSYDSFDEKLIIYELSTLNNSIDNIKIFIINKIYGYFRLESNKYFKK